MVINEKKIMAYLATPTNKAVLEKEHFERSAEVLQLKHYLASKNLLLDYELTFVEAEAKASKALRNNS